MLKLSAQTHAWLRHVYTAAGVAGSIISALALVSPDQVAALLASIRQIGDGLEAIFVAAGIIGGIGSALYARFTAKPEQQVAAVQALGNLVVPAVTPAAPSKGPRLQSSPVALALGLVVLAGLLAGCGASLDTPEKKAATLGVSYALLKGGVALYAAAPPCSDVSGPVCSDPAVVAQIEKAQGIADLAVARAQASILAAKDQTAMQIALQAGTDALAVFAKVTATYGIQPQPAPPALTAGLR